MDRVLSEEESHKAKPQIIQILKKIKNQVMVLAGIQTIWKCLESLNSKRIKHHLTAVGRPRAGCGERCSTWYQHLGSALSHTQALGQSFFSPIWREMATCNFLQKNVIGYCPENLLWSYITPLCHSCAQTSHF